MDIAKIRKKAQSKDKKKKTADKTEDRPVETGQTGEESETKDVQQEPVSSAVEANQVTVAPEDAKQAELQAPGMQAEEEETAGETQLLEFLTFAVLKEEFAVAVSDVEEIISHQSFTKVPTLPDYVLGITSLRGKIIPVIDLKIRLGLQKHAVHDSSSGIEPGSDQGPVFQEKILIVSGTRGLIGATIDSVSGVVKIPESGILEPPANLTEAELKFIEGVIILEKRFISIIRVEDALDLQID